MRVDGRELALFNLGGKFYCLDGKCSHKGGPLGEGEIVGTAVACPWHGSEFDIATGQAKKSPATKSVAVYSVKISGKDVLADI